MASPICTLPNQVNTGQPRAGDDLSRVRPCYCQLRKLTWLAPATRRFRSLVEQVNGASGTLPSSPAGRNPLSVFPFCSGVGCGQGRGRGLGRRVFWPGERRDGDVDGVVVPVEFKPGMDGIGSPASQPTITDNCGCRKPTLRSYFMLRHGL